MAMSPDKSVECDGNGYHEFDGSVECQICGLDGVIYASEIEDRLRRLDNARETCRVGVQFLLNQIASFTAARWDQHLRDKYGDEVAGSIIDALDVLEIRPYIPDDVDRRKNRKERV